MGLSHPPPSAFHFIEDPQLHARLLKDLENVEGACEIVIGLDSLSSIERANMSDTADAFVTMKLIKDPTMPKQLQSSSTRPNSLNPQWEPAEKFRFLVSNMSKARIVLSVYQHPSGMSLAQCDGGRSIVAESDKPLGDAVLKLQDYESIDITQGTQSVHLDLTDHLGKHQGQINLRISKLMLKEASNVEYESVYEYERWQAYGWGNSSPGHLLPTDPGSWSTDDGSKFANTREGVTKELRDDWKERQVWFVMGTSADPDGWQYAFSFDSVFWFDYPSASTFVRRRSHHREVFYAPEQ